MRLRGVLALIIVLIMVPVTGLGAGDPYLGIQHEVSEDPPGLLISVVPGAPAEVAGLRSGDVITELNGQPLSAGEGEYRTQLQAALVGLQVGDVFTVTVFRSAPQIAVSLNGEVYPMDYPLADLEQLIEGAAAGEAVQLTAIRTEQLLEIPVALGVRPDTTGIPFPANAELACDLADRDPQVRTFLDALSEQAGIQAQNADLWARLANRAEPDDDYKLSRVVYLLRDGLKGEAMTRGITDEVALACSTGVDGYAQVQSGAATLLDIPELYASAPMLRTGLSAAEHLDVLELVLNTAAVYVAQAFQDFSAEELEFIAAQRVGLTEIFSREHYIDSDDDDPRRSKANLRLVELAKRIDYEQLQLAQLTLAQLAVSEYLTGLRADLLHEFAGRLDESELLARDTALGKLVICGSGSTWHSGAAPALLIDLGGDDFYTTTAGSGVSSELPVSVLIELGGDDAYESTTLFSQGSGSLGCGLLIDAAGNDQYVGLQWAQGCGFFGSGALLDLAGDDIYRGEEFCQAAAIFGTGILIDFAGDDRMEGQMKCQAFGGAHAVGLLIDVAGDDWRYCKGKYPTGYGDPGIFDAWGQGCAMGFRGIASGGIAGVIDLAGVDYCEAGNFSQGGGYYFGYGFHHDRGWEDDRYLGSRYNQGFCAHQAVGVFLEDGGDDHYATRQAVAQGLAWDECTTMFVDYGGDDVYDGGGGFSQGASAHNALCVMWDRGGRDTYLYPAGQARAGGNDYHGGTSLSLFIDESGDGDYYTCERSNNNLIFGTPEYGFFADLDGTLAEALADDHWLESWIVTAE